MSGRKRKRTPWSTLKTFCKKYDITFPEQLSSREKEHLGSCEDCRNTWALFYIDNMNEPLEEIIEIWSSMMESDRKKKLKELRSSQLKRIKELALKRPPNAYQVFRKEKKRSDLPFEHQNMFISQLWKSLSEHERKAYQQRSAALKQKRHHTIKTLHKYDKQLYRKLVREAKDVISNKRPKKHKNSFMCFLASMRVKYKGEKSHHEIMKQSSFVWNRMSIEEKKPFVNESLIEKKRYLKEKDQMKQASKRRKVMKDSDVDQGSDSDTA